MDHVLVTEQKLLILERRETYGPVKRNKQWMIGHNEGLSNLYLVVIVKNIQFIILRWEGHVVRMEGTASPRKVLYGKLGRKGSLTGRK